MKNTGSTFARVSVGVPVYNGERYLEETLRSIQCQTLEEIEIIVSDNASTDRTVEIISDFSASDKRIRLERQRYNLGAAANYNRVFQLSRAQYFRWVPADDVIAPDLLARCVSCLDEESEAVLAYPKTELIDSASDHMSFYDDNLDLRYPKPYQRACALVGRINLCNAALGVHRSSALATTQLIQPFPGSDAVLLFECALRGPICEVDNVFFRRRVHNEASVEANPSAAERQAWYDPSIRLRRWNLPNRVRVLLEYLRVLQRYPFPLVNRMSIAASVVGTWSVRRARVNIGKWRRKLGFVRGEAACASTRFPDLR